MKYFEVVVVYFLIDIRGWMKMFLTFQWLEKQKNYQEKRFSLQSSVPPSAIYNNQEPVVQSWISANPLNLISEREYMVYTILICSL